MHNSKRIQDSIEEPTLIAAESMSVFCHGHPLALLRKDLSAAGVVMAKDLRYVPSGRKVRVSGIRVIVHTPPTKSGKRVMFITIEDESGLIDLVAFARTQKNYARHILTGTVITVQGTLRREGNGLAISITIEKVLTNWSGQLKDLMRRHGH